MSFVTGNGSWRFCKSASWGQLPEGIVFGGTHGAIASDRAGNVYVSTQSETGIVVYDTGGNFLKTIAHEFPEVHSMVCVQEGPSEYLYTTVLKGTRTENWLFVKMTTEGIPVLKITAPREAGFIAPNEWRLTAAVPGPDGDIWIANGYGDSRLFRFDRKGNYKAAYGGLGEADGLFKRCHGLTVDTRFDEPLLMICDRENRRLIHMDFDGKFVRTVASHLRRPCQVSLLGDYAIVSELEGRVTVLNKDGFAVAFLGDNPQIEQWAKYDIDPRQIACMSFSAAHGCHVDAAGKVYISDWNEIGRVSVLERILE